MSSEIQLHKQEEVVTKDGEQQYEQVLSISGEKNISNLEVSDLLLEEQIATRDDKAPAIIPRVTVATKTEDYIKYYVPKAVSIGPYHYGNEDLKPIQNLKLHIAKDLFYCEGWSYKLFSISEKNMLLVDLHAKLGEPERLQELRGYYEEKSTDEFNDKEFTNMLLLDGCFIISYFLYISFFAFPTMKKLSNDQMICFRQDLFLLENQIPFLVLELVMDHLKDFYSVNLRQLIVESTFQSWMGENNVFSSGSKYRAKNCFPEIYKLKFNHLLHLLRVALIKHDSLPNSSNNVYIGDIPNEPLPTAKELMDAGIHFQPTMSLRQIHFYRHWYWPISATVKLFPIAVHESTKLLCLNLIAYETLLFDRTDDMWVTSYIWLLNSLIGQPEDVKTLRDAGVLLQSRSTDVESLIKDIAVGLSAHNIDVIFINDDIQRHYLRFKGFNKYISQLKENYFNSPWSILALVGAIIALLLTAVQTYFTVWSPKDECADLCKFLKINHHL